MSADGDFDRTVKLVISRLQSKADRVWTPAVEMVRLFDEAATFIRLANEARLANLYGEESEEEFVLKFEEEYSALYKYFTDDANWKKPAPDDEE